ncbi:PIN domain-containing protein [Candidatus Woesearchaeota archaeon]|nr:PIN domain-containing protein [Candidatus Woesearchaeota archaeon]
MGLIIDTSVIIDIENKVESTIKKIYNLSRLHNEKGSISFITYYEFMYGIKKKSIKNQQRLILKIKKYKLLNTTEKTPEIILELKYKYDKLGMILPLSDLIIAAQTKEHNHLLVTKDSHFKKFDEIKKEII